MSASPPPASHCHRKPARRHALRQRLKHQHESRWTRHPRFESLEQRWVLASDWQNPFNPLDVRDDGLVVAIDALLAINEINAPTVIGPDGKLPARTDPQSPFFDTDGDSFLAPIDVLLVINAINDDKTAPVISAQLIRDTAPSGTNQDQITSDARITGTVRDDLTGVAKLEAQLDDGPPVPAAFDKSGVFQFASALANDGTADGEHFVRFRAVDSNGNTSVFGHVLEFVYDSQPPTTIPTIRMLPASDTGVSDADGITNDATPTFGFLVATDETVRVSVDDVGGGQNVLESLEFTAAALTDGSHTIAAITTDLAGNAGPSSQLVFTIDTQPPAEVDLDLSPNSDSGMAGDRITSDTRVTLVGQTESEAFVQLGENARAAIASHAGQFQLNGVPLVAGDNLVRGVVYDTAGNNAPFEITIQQLDATEPLDPVLRWNQALLESIRRDATPPPLASRNMAMMHAAVFDTVAAIDHTPAFGVPLTVTNEVSAAAAVSGAAHQVLQYLYPAQQAQFDTVLAAALADVPDGSAESNGLVLGREAGQAWIDARANDGWDDFVNDAPGTEPGDWQPTAPMFAVALLPQWATLTPFAMDRSDQFRPAGPPDLTSEAWARDFNEVVDLGRVDRSSRTAEQTQIARFWADGSGTYTPPGHWNQIAAQFAAQTGNSLAENARLFAELNIALADAAITAWDAKFAYDFWRPITAIQAAEDDGNDATSSDLAWAPLLVTPPFPEYVSGHSTFSGAAAQVLTSVFGDHVGFTTTSPSLVGIERAFDSFQDAAAEAGRSRIYGGIHFEFSNQDGLASGRSLADFVLERFATSTDSVPPTIVVENPASNATVSGNVEVRGHVLDNLAGVAKLEIQADDGPFVDLQRSSAGQFAYSTTFATDGAGDRQHFIRLRAQDYVANATSTIELPVLLDTRPPTITIQSPEDGAEIHDGTALIGVANGTGSSLTALAYAIDSEPAVPLPVLDDGRFHAMLDLSRLGAGTHQLTVTARDAAGHVLDVTRSIHLANPIPFAIESFSPENGATDVGTTVRPQIRFSRPVDAQSLVGTNFFARDSTGRTIPANIVPADDGSFAWLFPQEAMPGGSRIRITVDGENITARDGAPLDADGDGTPGGSLSFEFTTVSLAPLPNTSLVGIMADPGPDLKPGTFDDVRPGPDGTLGTADDIYLLPIQGATIFVLGLADPIATSGADGRFSLDRIPAGDLKLVVNGMTAVNAPTDFYFPEMVMDLHIHPGIANTVMAAMEPDSEQVTSIQELGAYLPRLRNAILRPVAGSEPTMIGVDALSAPNLTPEQQSLLQLEIPPESLIGSNGQSLGNADVGISTVPPELVRDMLPPGVLQHTFDITVQAPGVSNFSTPAPMTFPNVFGAAPGSQLKFLSFDHTTGRLVIEGTATVSADGKSVHTDPGTGITHPGWHGLAPPGGDGCSGGKPPEPPPAPEPGEVVVEHPPVALKMIYGETGELRHDALSWLPPGSAGPLPSSAATPCAAQKREPEKEKGKATRTVYIEIDGPLSTFMKADGKLGLVSQSFTLVEGSGEQKVLSGIAKTYDEIFGNKRFPEVFRDTLYGAQIKVTEVLKEPGKPAQRDVRRFELFRWIDVLDATEAKFRTGKTAVFTRAFADGSGGFERTKSVWFRLPASVETKIVGDPVKPFSYGAPVHGDGFAVWRFNPLVRDATDPVSHVADNVEVRATVKVAGTDQTVKVGELQVAGMATKATQLNINLPGFKAELTRVIKSLRNAWTPGDDDEPGIGGKDDDGNGVKDDVSEYGAAGGRDTIEIVYDHNVAPASSFSATILPGDDGMVGTLDDISLINPKLNAGYGGTARDFFRNFTIVGDRFKTEFADFLPGKAYTDAELEARVDIEVPLLKKAVEEDYQAINRAAGFDAYELVEVGGDITMNWVELGPGLGGHATYDSSEDFLRPLFCTPGKKYDSERKFTCTVDISDAAKEWAVAEALNHTADETAGGTVVPGEFAIGLNLDWTSPVSLAQKSANVVSHELAHTFGLNDAYSRVRGVHNVAPKPDLMNALGEDDANLTFTVNNAMLLRTALGLQPNKDRPITDAFLMYRSNVNLPDSETGVLEEVDPTVVLPVLSITSGERELFPDSVESFADTIADGVGGQSLTHDLRLTNVGSAPLTIGTMTLTGDSSAFSLVGTSPAGSILTPGESKTLTIQFDPTKAGPAFEQITINSDATSFPAFSFSLKGLAVANGPRLIAEAIGTPLDTTATTDAGLAPVGSPELSNDLGGAQIGQSVRVDRVIVMTNAGSEPLSIQGLSVASGAEAFSLVGVPGDLASNPILLGRNETFTIGVEFRPTREGLQHADVRIQSNDATQPQVHVGLVGTGLARTVTAKWGHDFVAIETPDVPGDTALQLLSDQDGNFKFFLPASEYYHLVVFDPETGLVGHGYGVTAPTGFDTDLTSSLSFAASTAPDTDFDGLPDDIEFAIGTSIRHRDTDRDGLSDAAEIEQGLDPLGSRRLPIGVVANLPLRGEATTVVIEGTPLNTQSQLAYVATGSYGLAIVDVSRFTNPIVLSQVDLPGSIDDVSVDPILQMAAVTENGGALHLLDVSDSERPAELKSIDGFFHGVEVVGGSVYALENLSIKSFDLVSGALVQTLGISSAPLVGLAREGTMLYVVDVFQKLTVVDISGASMVTRGSIDLTFASGQLIVGNGIAYVATGNSSFRGGFSTVDVSNPDAPALISDPDVLPPTEAPRRTVAVTGSGRALIAGSLTLGGNALDIVNITDPANTYDFVTRVPLTSSPLHLMIGAGLGYVASGADGLQVINYQAFDNQQIPPEVAIAASLTDLEPSTGILDVRESATVPLSVTTRDDVQVRNVELLLDGRVVANDVSFPFDFSVIAPSRTSERTSFTVQARATDTGGNSALSATLMIHLLEDIEPPTSTGSTPEPFAVLADRSPLFARFSEPLDVLLFDRNAVSLVHLGANGVVGGNDDTPIAIDSLAALNFDHTLAIYPAEPIPVGSYRLTVPPSMIADRAGNHLLSDFSLDFAYVSSLAVAPPRVTSANPAPNSQIQITDSIVLDFSANLDASLPRLGDFSLRTDGPDDTFGTGDDEVVPVSGIHFDRDDQLRITLSHALSAEHYQFRAVGFRLRDASQNWLDGEVTGSLPSGNGVLGGDLIYEFTAVPPRVIATSPAPNATVATTDTIEVVFDRIMKPPSPPVTTFTFVSAGADRLRGTSDDIPIPLTAAAFVGTGDRLQLSLANFLTADKYRLVLPADPFEDSLGNRLDGELSGSLPSGNGLPGGNFVLDFTISPPSVTSTVPVPDGKAGAIDRITINFDRPMNNTLPVPADFALVRPGPDDQLNTADDVAVPLSSISFTSSQQTLTLLAGSQLPADTYQLTSPAAKLIDRGGTRLDGEFDGVFPTGDGTASGDFVFSFEIAASSPSTAVREYSTGALNFIRHVIQPISGLPFNEARQDELDSGVPFFVSRFFVPAQLGNFLTAAVLSNALRNRSTSGFDAGYSNDQLVSQLEHTLTSVSRILTIPDFAYVDADTGKKAFYQAHDTQSGMPLSDTFARKVSLLDNSQLIAGLQLTKNYLASVVDSYAPELGTRLDALIAQLNAILSQFDVRMWFDGTQLHQGDTENPLGGGVIDRINSESRLAPVVGLALGSFSDTEFHSILDGMLASSLSSPSTDANPVERLPYFGTGLEIWAVAPYLTTEQDTFFGTNTLTPLVAAWLASATAAGLPAAGATGIADGLGSFKVFGYSPAEGHPEFQDAKVLVPPAAAMLAGALPTDEAIQNLSDTIAELKGASQWDDTYGAPNYLDYGTGLVNPANPVRGTLEITQSVVGLLNVALGGREIESLLSQTPAWSHALQTYAESLFVREAEFLPTGDGSTVFRPNAGGHHGWYMAQTDDTVQYQLTFSSAKDADLIVRYSDRDTGTGDSIHVLLDGTEVGLITTTDTGGSNAFVDSPPLSLPRLTAGTHEIAFRLSVMDGLGVELDSLRFVPSTVVEALLVEEIQPDFRWSDSNSPVIESHTMLTKDDIEMARQAAIAWWQAVGADTRGFAGLSVMTADLAPGVLGITDGTTIWLDRNAAGSGWFVDPTPLEHSEFSTTEQPEILRRDDDRIDLMTVLAHEMGHMLGQSHADGSDTLMSKGLRAGERRLPQAFEADAIFADW